MAVKGVDGVRHTIGSRFTNLRQRVKKRCDSMTSRDTRWRCIPGAVVAISTTLYVVLLILYSQQAKYTFQVSRMTKAQYCVVDFLGHKSMSLKQTSCCEVWLGVVCKRLNTMPCPSVSVKYKLLSENFERAGYINYWDPKHLIARYATNSHCMIVPITCPVAEDQPKYRQTVVNKDYKMKQSLECYVYRNAPERPLVIRAQLLPHLSLAVLLFIVPPLIILASLIACVVLRSKRAEEEQDDLSVADKTGSDKASTSDESQTSTTAENDATCSTSKVTDKPNKDSLTIL